MHRLGWLLMAWAGLALTGCSSAPSWLRGGWHFDRERTIKELKSQPTSGTSPNSSSSGGGFDFGTMMSGLTTQLDSQIIDQLNGMEVIVNRSEIISTIGGQGHVYKYQVVEHTDNKCVVKLQDGSVEAYNRDGDEMYVYSTGMGSFRLYMAHDR